MCLEMNLVNIKTSFSSFGYFLPPKSSLFVCSFAQENSLPFETTSGRNRITYRKRNAICLITDAVCIHIKYLREKDRETECLKLESSHNIY